MRRREIYKHDLYVKHVASNKITRFGPPPTPAKIANSADLQSRATAFVRRDLRALGWEDSSFSNSHRGRGDSSQDVVSPGVQRQGIDLEFMTSYVITLIKMIDLRGERGVRLLAEYLDPGVRDGEGRMKNTEHLAHGEK
jgi:E3 ubiquitin-protein ligase Topors